MTIIDPLLALIGAFTLCAAMVVRPHGAVCPDGWYVEGIRPSGSFYCRPRSLLPDHPSRGHEADDEIDPATEHKLHGRIYCEKPLQPVVINFRTVGCEL